MFASHFLLQMWLKCPRWLNNEVLTVRTGGEGQLHCDITKTSGCISAP